MSVYKACDIRGPVGELESGLYWKWGHLLGGKLPIGETFLVGGDVRLSTPEFQEAFICGLLESGVRVVDLGTLPTPMVYFAKRHLLVSACAIVTASHSPPEVNGLKWMVGDLPPSEADIQRLREETERGGCGEGRPGGIREVLDGERAYRTWLRKRWRGEKLSENLFCGLNAGAIEEREPRSSSVVEGILTQNVTPEGMPKIAPVRCRAILDPGNGCWSGRALEYLRDVFPEVEFLAIHDRVDGLFRERDPDSARPQHLRALAETVRRQQAGIGIAFDGDGDRVAFVDGEGQALTAEEGAWILIQSFGREWQDRMFVYDIKCSQRIPETVEALGGRPVAQRSGHAFIRTSMIEQEVLFGAEVSGHFFYGELQGSDDGLFTACRMLRFLEESGRSLAEWRRTCPPIFATPDLRLKVEPQEQGGVIAGIGLAFRDFPQSFLDGVRVRFPDGWALVRPSVTAPELTFRFEGESQAGLERIVGEVASRLGVLGRRLEEKYREYR